MHELEIVGTKLIRCALITEVSGLTPAKKPAEAFARVAWVGELEKASPKSVPTFDRAVAGEVIHTPPGQTLTRPNSGYVIGVR